MDFSESETKKNLLRAFAGESQAYMRYSIAGEKAKKQNKYVVQAVFDFTAAQEKQHAQVFYQLLNEQNGETIGIDGTYPVNLSDDVEELLRAAAHNEYEEYNDVYQAFGDKAKEEKLGDIASVFYMVAQIEKTHGDRFAYLADLIKEKRLFLSDVKTGWMCLKCGYVIEATEPSKKCPVCGHEQGYFIRLELAPYEKIPDHKK